MTPTPPERPLFADGPGPARPGSTGPADGPQEHIGRMVPARSAGPLRGYWPLAALLVVFALVVAIVPSRAPTSEAAAGSATAGAEGRAATGDVPLCADRADQIPGDSYSPPCLSFSGDNGGATTRGVDDKTIRVAYRVTPDTDYASVIQQMAASDIKPDTPEAVTTIRSAENGLPCRFER